MEAAREALPHASLLSEALRKAEGHLGRARRANLRVIVVALAASALSALLTALPAALNQPLVGTWRVTCGAAAFLSAVAAVTTGLQAHLKHADRIAGATECLGRLRALDVQHRLGAVPEAEFPRQFSEIVAKYPEYT
ncbi:MAG TPA: hypothetical protein VK002_13715 [Rubricoccaceae bacterium]|nr:hypothetical protein [Rubricoccaceae bacterium]